MKTSGPSGVTRRSRSDAIETVSASSHGNAVVSERHRRDIEMHRVDEAGVPRRSLQCDSPFEDERDHLPIAEPAERRQPAPHCLSAPVRHPPAPDRRRGSRFLSMLSGVVTIITGPASSVENTRAEGGIRSRRSNSTRASGRRRCTSRAVSSGSSAMTVPEPDGNRVDLGAHRVRVAQRIVRADARALARLRRHAIVEARRGLHDHERPMLRLEREVGAVQPERALAAGAH